MFGGAEGKALQVIGEGLDRSSDQMFQLAQKITKQHDTANLVSKQNFMLDSDAEFDQAELGATDPNGRLERYDAHIKKVREKLFIGDDGRPLSKAARLQLELNASQHYSKRRRDIAMRGVVESIQRRRQSVINGAEKMIVRGDLPAADEFVDAGIEAELLTPEDGEAMKMGFRPKIQEQEIYNLINVDPDAAYNLLKTPPDNDPYADISPSKRTSLIRAARTERSRLHSETIQSTPDTAPIEVFEDYLDRGIISRSQFDNLKRTRFKEVPQNSPEAFGNIIEQIDGYDPTGDPLLEGATAIRAQILTGLDGDRRKEADKQLDARLDLRGVRRKASEKAGRDLLRESFKSRTADEDLTPEHHIELSRQHDEFQEWADNNPNASKADAIRQAANIIEAPERASRLKIGIPTLQPTEGSILPPAPGSQVSDTVVEPTTFSGSFGGQPISNVYSGAKATVFGGPNDPVDNGLSAFGGKTGTGGKEGVAIPQAILEQVVGGGKQQWAKTRVRVTSPDGITREFPVVDLGTHERIWEREGRPTLDLTEGAAKQLGAGIKTRNGKTVGLAGIGDLKFEIIPPTS